MEKLLMALLLLFAIQSCKKPEDGLEGLASYLNEDTVNLKRHETFRLRILGEKIYGQVYFSSGNDLIATVDDSGVIKGQHVGATRVYVMSESFMGNCLVCVTPEQTFFREPLVDFSATRDDIIEYEERLQKSSNENSIVYYGDFFEKYVTYLFGDSNRYVEASVTFNWLEALSLGDFLAERYIQDPRDIYLYQSIDGRYSVKEDRGVYSTLLHYKPLY